MKATTLRSTVAGPAGTIECAIDPPTDEPRGLAVLCHPHPLHGGTMDNKVVQTLARALVALGYTCVRFNFRGVGGSSGAWDGGVGEVEDALAVVKCFRLAGQELVLGGFSFGARIAAQLAARLPAGEHAARLILVGPAVANPAMPAVAAGTIVVHGETDDVVPLAAVLDWARPQALPITVLPGAGHFFHGQLTVLKQIVTAAWAPCPAP
jgi:hypothetical protein